MSNEDFLLDDLDDDKTIEFIKSYLPQDFKETFSDDELFYLLDLIDEYYMDSGVLDSTTDADGFIELNLDDIVDYILAEAKKDDMGEFAKDIRCVGPISVHDSGVFEFERLFWDDGKHIKEIRLVEVKVTLNNGAVVTWAGKENVDKHKAGSYNLNNM